MKDRPIFLSVHEQKDELCLAPLSDSLAELGLTPKWLDFSWSGLAAGSRSELREYLTAANPILLTTSVVARDIAKALRSGRSQVVVALEHGIAPFKTYTWSEGLLDADIVFSPSQLFRDRLAARFPEHAHRLRGVAYPRLWALGRDRDRCLASPAAKGQSPAVPGKAIVLSWGASAEAIEDLAQLDDVVVLLHPADALRLESVVGTFDNVCMSSADRTPEVLAGCRVVFGDFSSLTFESLALGIPTYFFLDPELYALDPDLPSEFMDPRSAAFTAIESVGSMQRDAVLIGRELWEVAAVPAHKLAESVEVTLTDRVVRRLSLSYLPPGFLPEVGQTDPEVCAAAILREVECLHSIPGDSPVGAHANRGDAVPLLDAETSLEALAVIENAYAVLLRRQPDTTGLMHYFADLSRQGVSFDAVAALWSRMYRSDEGQQLLANARPLPRLTSADTLPEKANG